MYFPLLMPCPLIPPCLAGKRSTHSLFSIIRHSGSGQNWRWKLNSNRCRLAGKRVFPSEIPQEFGQNRRNPLQGYYQNFFNLAFEKLMKTHPSRLIPAVTNLVVFELCARHLSFTRAGQTLGLSQGAISRQVSELEEFLGQALFQRGQRKLSLLPAGKRYAELIRPHLHGLEQATNELRLSHSQTRVVRVSVPISLCTAWLVPRLPKLYQTHPDLLVNVSPEMGFGDSNPNAVDVMIVQRETPPSATDASEFLLPIYGSALCAPQLMRGRARLELAELLCLPLLHHVEAPNLWAEFVADAGHPEMIAPPGVANLSFIVNIQFALAGMGVALLPEYLVEKELASGQLVRAFDHSFNTGRAYYLTCNEGRRHLPQVMEFREWISDQALECRQSAAVN
jgi:DNA-binding transcriptional LysR family regulator